MVGRKNKTKKGKTKKVSKKPSRSARHIERRHVEKHAVKPSDRDLKSPSFTVPVRPLTPIISQPDHPVFSIEIDSINGETTVGDLIVAFPRTRDVLMKHGLRFDVDQAGYLYMTLNVFSAIHGLSTNNLIQELHTASKEPAPQPTTQPLRPITTVPTA